jgi:hypothetical protein
MKVLATPGLKVPTEHNPREYITEDANAGLGVDIEVTAYYLRRLADNELVEVAAVPQPPTEAAASAAKASKAAA